MIYEEQMKILADRVAKDEKSSSNVKYYIIIFSKSTY